ncbi:PREDICTED: cell cycle checkpoint control protein RAD9A isoform X2 [Myotis davidii]|uniref:cell cycle checkpoint control protein RAD9A isoform X2 n=1 Tax=Myotis davidii TaxID=225400 RepID=UPI0007670748|nr:PREDICTED: cell cycle checkpoint control protein RAD9A isoform X2 [Myotis davidii]
MLHLPEWQEQPPGGPAALQVWTVSPCRLSSTQPRAPICSGPQQSCWGRLSCPSPLHWLKSHWALAMVAGSSCEATRRKRQVSLVPAPTDSTIKAMVTEMSIGQEDFQQLQAEEGVAITFCLKEFRGLLSFAESANLSLSIHFDAPGRPAIFAIKDSLLDGHFVLATLSEPTPNSQDLHFSEPCQPAPQCQAHSTPQPDDFASDDIDSYMIAMETTVGSESSRTLPSISPSPGLQPPCNSEGEEDEAEAELSTVPGTPPPKKFRSLFFGSILAPAHSPLGPSPVLAEGSEGEG